MIPTNLQIFLKGFVAENINNKLSNDGIFNLTSAAYSRS